MQKLLFLFLLISSFALAAQELVIVSTADLHGETAAFARLASAIQAKKPDILIDAGDLFSGNFTTVSDGGESMIRALNQLHYDAWVPGNHDFDLPVSNVNRLAGVFRGKTLGNWRTEEVPSVLPWMSLDVKGVHIFIIGCGVPDQAQRLVPDGKFTQISYDEALTQGIAAARAEKADMILLVAHRGIFSKEGDLGALLSRHPGIDLVIGSHTHQADRGENLGNAYYIQPGAHAQSAACAVVTFSPETKKIKQIESFLIAPEKYGELKLELLFAEAEKKAHQSGDFPEIALAAPLRLPKPGSFDCEFVHLAAEAMRRAAQTQGAIYDGFADDREVVSPLTPRKLFHLAPYCGRIIVGHLTREEVRGVMEEMLQSMSLKKPGAVPGFAGIDYAVKRKNLTRLELPDEMDVAIGSYRFCRSAALAKLRCDRSRWRDTGILERDAIWSEILRRNQK